MSTYQIRSLSLGGVLDQAVAITKNHFGPLAAIMVITVAPFSLAANWMATMQPVMPPNPTQQDLQIFIHAQQQFLMMFFIVLLPSLLATVIGNAAMLQAIADVYLGKSFTPFSAIGQAFRKFGPLFGTSILVGLTVGVGLVLCFVPGIIFMLWYGLATQVVIVEGISGIPAMKRSKALMTGNVGSFFVLLLVIGLINGAIGAVANFIPQPHLRALMATVVQTVLSVFASAAVVVFYFSARCKNEQFDLQLLADNIGTEIVLEADDDQRSAE